MLIEGNTPDWIRTCDRRIRNPELYPAELRALLFQQVGEPYRRLRNTFKILLGNMRDEKVAEPASLPLIDQWIMERLQIVCVSVPRHW